MKLQDIAERPQEQEWPGATKRHGRVCFRGVLCSCRRTRLHAGLLLPGGCCHAHTALAHRHYDFLCACPHHPLQCAHPQAAPQMQGLARPQTLAPACARIERHFSTIVRSTVGSVSDLVPANTSTLGCRESRPESSSCCPESSSAIRMPSNMLLSDCSILVDTDHERLRLPLQPRPRPGLGGRSRYW